MRGLKELPSEYFDKFTNKKVKIKPFDPNSRILAREYIELLNDLLRKFSPEIVHRGSTSFGIAGKGEIELGVFPRESDWTQIINELKKKYGEPGSLEDSYARFNDTYNGMEIEIIVMKGEDALIDRKIHEYLLSHLECLKEYEKIKYKYAYSKKEYMIQKDRFFRKVAAQIP